MELSNTGAKHHWAVLTAHLLHLQTTGSSPSTKRSPILLAGANSRVIHLPALFRSLKHYIRQEEPECAFAIGGSLLSLQKTGELGARSTVSSIADVVQNASIFAVGRDLQTQIDALADFWQVTEGS